jgi:hypothetical protein
LHVVSNEITLQADGKEIVTAHFEARNHEEVAVRCPPSGLGRSGDPEIRWPEALLRFVLVSHLRSHLLTHSSQSTCCTSLGLPKKHPRRAEHNKHNHVEASVCDHGNPLAFAKHRVQVTVGEWMGGDLLTFDKREGRLLAHVLKTAPKGNVSAVLEAMDFYSWWAQGSTGLVLMVEYLRQ